MAVREYQRCLCLLPLIVLIVTLMPHVAAQPLLTVPAPAPHGPKQILDFYAGGISDSYTLQVSPQGGTLSESSYVSMYLMPWGYVSTHWTTGTV
ncbi:MAG TPA: hypothetical protein VEI80_03500, partial [Candidatus Acidoferrales bacterium]|nr:hypothetical protein [Candidatus Acidoferrales bacterium]